MKTYQPVVRQKFLTLKNVEVEPIPNARKFVRDVIVMATALPFKAMKSFLCRFSVTLCSDLLFLVSCVANFVASAIADIKTNMSSRPIPAKSENFAFDPGFFSGFIR